MQEWQQELWEWHESLERCLKRGEWIKLAGSAGVGAPVQIQRAEWTELLVPVKEERSQESGAGLIVGWEQTRKLTHLWNKCPKKRSDGEWKNEGMSRLKHFCSKT